MHPNGSTSLIMAWLLELSWQPWTIMPTLVGNKPLYPGVPTKGAAIQGSVSEKYQRMGGKAHIWEDKQLSSQANPWYHCREKMLKNHMRGVQQSQHHAFLCLLFYTLFLRRFFSRLIYWFELKWFYSAHDEGLTKKQFVLKLGRTITRPQVLPITYVTGSFGRPLI